MKIIVTHASCDLDGITSIWLIKRFLSGWEDAELRFVSAGERLGGHYETKGGTIEVIEGKEVIHVDTGFGTLDHHNTPDQNVCGARLTFDFVLQEKSLLNNEAKREAIARMVDVVVDNDHFQEVFYKDPLAYYHDFSLEGILDGARLEFYHDDEKVAEYVMTCLDAILHTFENRIWAEHEIAEKGIKFKTRWGKGLGIETLNDEVLKLAQMMGYVIVIRKDPKSGFARIKARPNNRYQRSKIRDQKDNIDLTPISEHLKKMDPQATWFLHISKRMLLNGSSKNPKMRGTKLSLDEIINVLKK